MLRKKLYESRVVGENINGPRLDLGQDSGVEVFNLVCHDRRLANTLTADNPALVTPNQPIERALPRCALHRRVRHEHETCDILDL